MLASMRPSAAALLTALLLPLLLLAFGAEPSSWTAAAVGDGGVDAWGTQWFYWMTGEWLGGAAPLIHNSWLFFPDGKDVYLHTGGNALDATIAAPVLAVFGRTAGYNVFLVALLMSNGLAGWALARASGGGPLGCAVGAAAFAMCPTALAELAGGRPTQVLLAPLAGCLAVGWSLLQGGFQPRRAVATGVLLFVVGISYWFNALFLALAAAPAVAIAVWRAPTGGRAAIVAGLLLAGGVALVMVLPFAAPMIAALGQGAVPGLLDVSAWTATSWGPLTREGVEVGVQVLDVRHLRTGFVYDNAGERLFEEGAPAFSAIALALAGVGLWQRRALWPFAVIAGSALLLAMGPNLDVASGLGNPLYIGLSKLIAPLQRMWWPSRALVVFHLALVPLVAVAADRLGASRPSRQALVALLAVIGLGAELHLQGLVPLPYTQLPALAVDQCLRDADGALIELPANGDAQRLVRQATHRRPMFGGMLEDNPVFVPAAHRERAAKNSYVAALLAASNGVAFNPPSEADRAALGALGFQWVLIHRAELGASLPAAAQSGLRRRIMRTLEDLLGRPVWSDSDVLLYAPWGGTIACAGG
jgi:hypothetical protein